MMDEVALLEGLVQKLEALPTSFWHRGDDGISFLAKVGDDYFTLKEIRDSHIIYDYLPKRIGSNGKPVLFLHGPSFERVMAGYHNSLEGFSLRICYWKSEGKKSSVYREEGYFVSYSHNKKLTERYKRLYDWLKKRIPEKEFKFKTDLSFLERVVEEI